MQNKLILTPKPKYIQIEEKSGLRLSNLLRIYINKHKIRDYVMQISNKFYKHLGVFLEVGAISDSYIDIEHDENYFVAIIATEYHYTNKKRKEINQIIENMVEKIEKITEQVNKNSFAIKIFDESVCIISKTDNGFNYAVNLLIQIMENAIFIHENPEEFIILPELFIFDYSKSKFRGIHLDMGDYQY
jgi:N-acetyl-beta-hexosaminidase